MQHTLKRLARAFTPFMLLLLGVMLYYAWAARDEGEVAQQTATLPAANATDSSAESGITAAAVSTSQPVETLAPVATAIPTATLPAGDLARLVGPPTKSFFPLGTAISFYWTSTYAPRENQAYGVFVTNELSEKLVGTVESPNFGRQFQLRVQSADLGLEPGHYSWDVRLLEEGNPTARWQSLPRSFIIEDTVPTD